MAVRDGERSLLTNGNDVEILNENAMIQSLPFAMLDRYNLRPLFSRDLDISVAGCISSQLAQLVEDYPTPHGQEHLSLDHCWSVLQALVTGLACQLIDRTRIH